MIKALLLDDEPDALHYLKSIIKKTIPEIELTFATSNLNEAKQFIKNENPQLVFLDVEMPLQNGFEFLLQLEQKHFDVIFTTGFSKYAIQAIRFSAIDFLLKPVQADELRIAFDRFLGQPKEIERRQKIYENLFENLKANHESAFKLSLLKNNKHYFISPKDIYYCKADDNYTKLYLEDNSEFIVSRTMKEIEEMLEPYQFIRIHKSSLANKNHISNLSKNGVLMMNNKVGIEVSRRRMESVLEFLSSH
jgi:two-component system, LytTR family, response regulator